MATNLIKKSVSNSWTVEVTHDEYPGMKVETDVEGNEEDARSAADALEGEVLSNPAKYFEV